MTDKFTETPFTRQFKEDAAALQPKIAGRRRIVMEEGCGTCAELASGSFGPYHDASPRCESGKRNHCTCDVCF